MTADDYVNTALLMMPSTMQQRQQIAAELRSPSPRGWRTAIRWTTCCDSSVIPRSSPIPICQRSRW